MIWAKEEYLPREDLRALQLERLKKQVARAYEKVPVYREKMEAAGVRPKQIRNLDDIRRLPFIDKKDFRLNYPLGLFAVPKDELARIHASSGTTGTPTVVGYTRRDLESWAETVARIAVMGGATSTDIAQICFGYGMFTGALGLHSGLERIGASVVPSSVGNSKRQLMFMRDLGTTLLVATPSYALHLAELAKEEGMVPGRDLHLRVGLLGGEGMSERLRNELKRLWGEEIILTQNYGLSEVNGPGVAGECRFYTGQHINEDHFYAEIIDPETGETLPPGEKGELVLTCLTKEALPLIRYRTHDLTRLFYEPCRCGRTTARMANLYGRSDDMLIIRGVNVFPSQIEEVLAARPEISPNYEITVERVNHLDKLTVAVELGEKQNLDSYSELDKLRQQIHAALQQALGLDVAVKLENPRSLARFEGKAKRVNDLRTAESEWKAES